MSSQVTLGPFLTKPAISAGTEVRKYIDPLNPNAYVVLSTGGGGQPTTAPVENVRIDLYAATDNPDNITPGKGLYTGLTDANGMVTFTLPDIQ